jgi:serine protease inhibitor
VDAGVLLGGCDAITGPGQPQATWTAVALDERVVDAYTGFGFELFGHLRAADPDGNIFMSPTSAALALAMTYNGAVGQTELEMARTLGIDHLDRETVNTTNRVWLEALGATGDPQAELVLANSIWYR